jgi:hypothetical protein
VASDLTEALPDELSPVAAQITAGTDALKSDTAEIARPATEKIAEVAQAEKALGADKLRTFAQAVHAAADNLDAEMPGVASHVRQAGGWIDQSAVHLREQRFEEMIDSIDGFARRNPALAFMAASLAGLALARFLKSAKKTSSG